ncbi:MAG: type II toxin-antitoxin system RelE/ParE family toxin [Rhodanobacteraceae bacterium]
MTPRKPRLVYTATAVDDLIRLRAFIAEHDPAAARRVGADLVNRMELLRDAPLIGRIVVTAPDPETVRDMVFGHYIVRYAVTVRTIMVLRVWHHFEHRK